MALLQGRFGLPAAIVIRCAGGGGRCRRQLGVVEVIPGRLPTDPFLLLTNHGWGTTNKYPRIEEAVPSDFEGDTGSLSCPKHSRFWEGQGAGRPRPDWPPDRASWQDGDGVRMPFWLLKEPYERFLRTGATQTVSWLPGKSPTVILDMEGGRRVVLGPETQ